MLGTLCLSTKEPITTKHRFSGPICAGFGVPSLHDRLGRVFGGIGIGRGLLYDHAAHPAPTSRRRPDAEIERERLAAARSAGRRRAVAHCDMQLKTCVGAGAHTNASRCLPSPPTVTRASLRSQPEADVGCGTRYVTGTTSPGSPTTTTSPPASRNLYPLKLAYAARSPNSTGRVGESGIA